MPKGPLRITRSFYDPSVISSETEVTNEEIKVIIILLLIVGYELILNQLVTMIKHIKKYLKKGNFKNLEKI